MPIVEVWGVPDSVSRVTLAELRDQIIKTVAREMGCKPEWVRVFYPQDMLAQGENEDVFVYVKTAVLAGREDANEVAIAVTEQLATMICATLQTHNVECFIEPLPKNWRHNVHAKRK
ncbi:MAG: hypothetical protein HY577_01735 [Candidatus Nealsonbacteria bacterium]|nr:hypothetical protein [Candidatus Nealsonbacteria bacterium]